MKKLYKLLLGLSVIIMVACGEEKNLSVGTTSKNYSSLGLPIYYGKITDSSGNTTSESYDFTPKEKGIIAVTLRSTYKDYDIGKIIHGIDLIEEIPHKIFIKYEEDNKGFITFSWNEAYMTIPFIIEYNTPKVMQPSSKRNSFLETMYNDIKKEHGEKAAKEAIKEYYNTTLEPQFFINGKKTDFEYVRNTVENILDTSEKDSENFSFNKSDIKSNSNNNYKFKGDTLEEREKKRIKRMQYLKNIDDPNAYFEIMAIMEEQDRDEKETYGIKTTSPFDPPQNTKVGQLLPNGMIDNLGAISITQSGKYFYSRNFMYDVDKELGKTMAEYIEFFVGDKIPSDGSTKGKTIKKYMKDIAKKNNWMCIYQIDTQTDTIYMIYCLTENINYPPNAEIRVTIDPGYDSSIGGYIPSATHVEYKKLK